MLPFKLLTSLTWFDSLIDPDRWLLSLIMIHDLLGPKGGEDAPDFTTCMFCGDHDNKWNEDALDLHYWKVRTWYDSTVR